MASVAADPSAIAPPLPLPSRPDAAPPAGPAGAFADLLDASAAPASVPQPQPASVGRTNDGSTAGQTGTGAASGPSETVPAKTAAAPSSPASAKGAGRGKPTDDLTADDGGDGGSVAANASVSTVLAIPPFAFAPLPAADQTPETSGDARTASVDPATPTQDDTNSPPTDHKDAGASSDSLPTGLAAALPGLVPFVAIDAPPSSSAPTGTSPSPSLPSAPTAAAIASPPSTSAPAAEVVGADIAVSSPQQPDGTGQHTQPPSTAALDLLTAVAPAALAPPTTGELQTAALRTLVSTAANTAAPDRNAPPAPAAPPTITADTPSATLKPASLVAALTPPAAAAAVAAQIEAAAQTASNANPPRDAGAVAMPLPAQIAVRFAAAAHTTDDSTSDSGTDLLGGASVGATTPAGSTPPGVAIAQSFTGMLSTMQAPPGAVTAQHAAVPADAVPLAAVPIVIVARAEAGERKFEIRLDPPDLGRIEVQLNVDSSGHATSHLVVDRADTLDLLRRDAPALERALQSAGLTTDNGSLQFSLRDQSFAGRDQGTPAPLVPPAAATAAESDSAPLDTALRRYGAAAGLGGGIDIRV